MRLIYSRYLEGRSLVEIQRELTAKNIPTAEGVQGWSRQVIRNILTSEKYIGDGLRQKTYTTGPIGNKKVVKNNGELPMYYARDNHPAIIPRDIFYRVKEEMARRTSKRKVLQKTAKTEQGKYSAKYALSELLICGECGTPYKRCTWTRNGKKRIVWRCVSRLEFGTKYCHNSPTLDEDKLHKAITTALNEYGAIRAEIKADVLELTELAQSGGEGGGTSLPELRQRLDALTAEQALLLEEILEDMDNLELNAQLKTLAEEKQDILDQIAAHQQDEEQQAIQASRRREMEEWLDQQPICLTEYDDTLTRRFMERITMTEGHNMAIFITGDTHGDFTRFKKEVFYEQAELTKEDCIIITGDFGGVWDSSANERYWLDWLEQKPFTTLFVSGNHENFDLLAEYPVEDWCGGTVQRIRPSVIHLMRGQVYSIQGKKFFTMGG